VGIGSAALTSNLTGQYNAALGYGALSNNSTGNFNSGLGYATQTGDFSGSVILGAKATATDNGQFALGSSTHPIGPITGENPIPNAALQINLNGVNVLIPIQIP
jgi:hypothetical protein